MLENCNVFPIVFASIGGHHRPTLNRQSAITRLEAQKMAWRQSLLCYSAMAAMTKRRAREKSALA
jgi:hypothetical protein